MLKNDAAVRSGRNSKSDKWISDSENTPPPSENEAEIINLAGEWGLKLGSYANGTVANDTCSLPGTLSENEKGTKTIRRIKQD